MAGQEAADRLTLAPAARGALERAARAPRESCGGLLGTADGGRVSVAALIPCSNRATGEDAFELDLDELHARARQAADGRELVGVYHTHPRGGPSLSPLDRHYLSLSEWVWLVAALDGDGVALAAYAWRDGDAVDLPVRIR